MSVYVVGNYTIHDENMYLEYIKRVGRTVMSYGGETIVADHEHQILEGIPSQVVVIVRFESMEKAKLWYNSIDYQSVIGYRKGSSKGWVTLCEEFCIPVKGGVE